jgi:hypothetical protein
MARVLGIGKHTARVKATEVVTVNPYTGSREITVEIRHFFDSNM